MNTNGVISFKRPLSQHTPVSFPIDDEDIIAPYWTDIDTVHTGNIFFKESIENELLDKITSEIRAYNDRLFEFNARWAFIVTWENVLIKNNVNYKQKV